MVKVFGCRSAYENRPSTNPRACGDGLWGFQVLPGRGDGMAGAAVRSAGISRVRFFADWPRMGAWWWLISSPAALILARGVHWDIGRNDDVAA